MVKLPSKVPVTDSRYGGALWLQPGGPGVSGIGFLQRHGKAVQMIIDSEIDASDPPDKSPMKLPKYFDLISIDPRGVNNTTPRFSCFQTAISRQCGSYNRMQRVLLEARKTPLTMRGPEHRRWVRDAPKKQQTVRVPSMSLPFT